MATLIRFINLILSIALLTSCSNLNLTPIRENLSIAATINIKDMSVSFIDLDDLKKITDWKLNKPYTGAIILPDQDILLLFGKQLETVDLYSLKAGQLIDSWKTGKGIVNAKLLQTRSNIALVDQNLRKIRFFDLNGNEEDAISTGPKPHTIVESPYEQKLFVLSFMKEKLTVIDLNKMKTIDSFSIHPAAAGAWFNEGKKEIWIGGHGAGAEVEKDIHVYQSDTGTLIQKFPVPSMPVNVLSYNKAIYVLSHGSSKLYKMNENGDVLNSVIIGANPFEMAVFDDELIVAGYDSNAIYLVEPESLSIKKSIPVGNGPFQIVLRERK